MLCYSVFDCFPSQGLDSVIFFDDPNGKPLYSYIFKSEEGGSSFSLATFLCEIHRTNIPRLPRPVAEDIIFKNDALLAYEQTKRLVTTFLKVSADHELQIAYRAARRNYIEAVRALDNYSQTFHDLTLLKDKKEEADAIFKVIRRVYEQEHLLNECLPRCFDGLTEETIDSIYKQEILEEQMQIVDKDLFDIDDYVIVNTERLISRRGKVVRIFPAGVLCPEIIYQVNYEMVGGNTTSGQFKASELSPIK